MIAQHARLGVRQPLRVPIERHPHELDGAIDLSRVVDPAAVGRPGGRVAAPAVEVGDIEEGHDSLEPSAVGQLP